MGGCDADPLESVRDLQGENSQCLLEVTMAKMANSGERELEESTSSR